jgi:uncharacterized protein (TIGR01777 family)
MLNVVIIGGTGFIGKSLIRKMLGNDFYISVIGRNFSDELFTDKRLDIIKADTSIKGPWQEKVSESDVIINLAGASIFTRWSTKTKKEIYETRIFTTQNIVEALRKKARASRYLLNASAVGYYGDQGDEILDETSNPGDDFLARLTKDWEREAKNAQEYNTQVRILRIGVVLGKNGGAFPKLRMLFKYCLGAELGTGKQWFSWIHEEDLIKSILFLIKNRDIEGPINAVSPNPITNSELTLTLAKLIKRPLIFPPVPTFIVHSMLGEFSDLLLHGQRVEPKKLIAEGFTFSFPKLEDAIKGIL